MDEATTVETSVPSMSPTMTNTTSPSSSPTSKPTEPEKVEVEPDESTNMYNNPTPKIGPWPECVGWYGEDCAVYIRQEIDDDPEIRIIKPGTPDPHRVFVVVDEYNVVVKVPHRG